MKRLLAILCTLALMLSVINPAAFAAENSSLQAAMDDDSTEIIVLEADTSNVTIDRDTTIDLNGHNIDGVTVLAGTLYCMDSQTADYTVADGVYGHVTNVTGNVKAAEDYLQVGDSFHAVNLDIYAMTLRAADVGVYYKSNFAADEIVAAQVESFGVALSVVTAPNAQNLETYCGYSEFTGFEAGEGANAVGTSTLLRGIMKAANGDNKNAKNAAMPVYGRAYIKTAEGYVFGETVKRSLQEQVEAIDGVWESLKDSQKAPVLGMLESYASVMEGWNIPNIQGIQVPGADEEIQIPVNVTAENGIVTEAVTVEQGAISITVPAGVKLAESAEKLTLTVTPKETSDAGLTLEESQVLMPMDVHVDGLAADNAQPITIYLGKVMAENLNMGNYTVYHVENGKANEMTLIPVDAEFTAHNQYKYTLDGELTLYMATFSEVAVVSEQAKWEGGRDYSWYNTTDTTLYIRNADQLAGFGAIVGDMAFKEVEVQEGGYTLIDIEPIVDEDSFAGKTVVLLADIDLGDKDDASEHIFYPIGYGNANMSYVKPNDGTTVGTHMGAFEGTFDGNGNTISNFYQNTWQMWGDYDGNNYRAAMGLFAYVVGGTVKNLTVDNFSSDGEFTPTGVIAAYAENSTFENIAITDCNPRVYNTGNGGIIGIGGRTDDTSGQKLTLKNITVDNSNKITALWGSWDVACGGLIGMFRGNADGGNGTISFENCHVAAQIDVYNDVCANYQYYAYRYSGMMIGSVRHNVKDENGYVYPNMTGITASGCTVHFGDWNDYYYCELVANTTASYTHDHQMSRLVQVTSVDATNMKIVTLKGEEQDIPTSGRVNYVVVEGEHATENATCFHFVDGAVWNHEDAGRHDNPVIDENNDGVADLKEDKQHIYREFNNLFTGYGWGVTSKAIKDYKEAEINILDRETADSQTKFIASTTVRKIYTTGETIEAGTLFSAVANADINAENVQVFVVPADPTDSENTVGGVYTADATDWTKGKLTISGRGEAVVSITDYEYCKTTTISITVRSYTEDLVFEDDAKTTAYCPACKTTVTTWIAWGGDYSDTLSMFEKGVEGHEEDSQYQEGHYYLNAKMNFPVKGGISYAIYGSKILCLHLNSYDITASGGTAIYVGGRMNIMGTGVVSGNRSDRGSAIDSNSSAGIGNLYGGTYKKADGNTASPIINLHTNKATINLYDGAIVDGSNVTEGNTMPAVLVRGKESTKKATFNMYGGVIKDATRASGIGASVEVRQYGIFNMYGGSIQNGSATNGGNVYSAGVTNMTGGTIEGGSATTGGNVYIADSAQFDMSGGTIESGSAATGGNVYIAGSAQFNMSGGLIDSGTAQTGHGGNAYIKGTAKFEMTGGTITEGYAPAQYGGNIYANGENAQVNILGGTVSEGKARMGGNIATNHTPVVLRNCKILNGTANLYSTGEATHGGNVSVDRGTLLIGEGTLIEGGNARSIGGNVRAYGTIVTMEGGIIRNGVSGTGSPNVWLATIAATTEEQADGTVVITTPATPAAMYMKGGQIISDPNATTGGTGILVGNDTKLYLAGNATITDTDGATVAGVKMGSGILHIVNGWSGAANVRFASKQSGTIDTAVAKIISLSDDLTETIGGTFTGTLNQVHSGTKSIVAGEETGTLKVVESNS